MITSASDPCAYCEEVFVGTGPTREDADNEARSLKSGHESSCDSNPQNQKQEGDK